MEVVFVHDHKFRKINGSFYSPGGLPNDVLSRYAEWFGHVTAVGRIISENQAKPSYSEITNPDVDIVDGGNLQALVKNADCIIARLPSVSGYKAVHFAKRFKKPYLVEVVGCVFDAYWNYGLKGKIFAVPAYFVMRHCVKTAPYALYVTSKFLQRRYPCKGKTAGVSDVAIKAADVSVLQSRLEKIEKTADTLVLGTAGAIDVDYKGQEFVIRAIPELVKRTGKDVTYELVGAGDSRRLKKIALDCGVEDRVIFKGVLKHDDMFRWYDSIDLYVQSSLLEGLSRAVVEAMSRGLPCIAANKGGNPELIEPDYLFSTKRRKKIPAQIIEKVLKAQDNKEQIAKRNFFLANQEYNCEELKKIRERFYYEFKDSCKL